MLPAKYKSYICWENQEEKTGTKLIITDVAKLGNELTSQYNQTPIVFVREKSTSKH